VVFYSVLTRPGPRPPSRAFERIAPFLRPGSGWCWVACRPCLGGTALWLPAEARVALVLALGFWLSGGLHVDWGEDTARWSACR